MKGTAPLVISLMITICLLTSGFSSEPTVGSSLADPDIWVNPQRFDFVVETGLTDSDTLTVGNNGTAFLDYTILGADAQNDVLVLDGANAGSTNALNALTTAGFNVTNAGRPSLYTGTPDPSNFDLMILLIGDDYTNDMPNAGQTAIESYVNNGGGIIMTEWIGFHVQNGRYTQLSAMVPMLRTAGNHAVETCNVLLPAHRIADGIPASFMTVHHSFGVMSAKSGTSVVVDGSLANHEVAFRGYSSGMAVHFATVGRYSSYDAWTDPDLTQLLLNSANWLTNNGSYSLPDWLTVTPPDGMIAPSVTRDHQFEVDTATLAPGNYYYDVEIESNDPNEDPLIVPVTLLVTVAHNLRTSQMSVNPEAENGKPLWINGTIVNEGFSDEVNVIVQLQLDYTVINFTVIPLLVSLDHADVSFIWTPSAEGSYILSIYAVPVVGESITGNNWQNRTVNVTNQADVWVTPNSFDFTIETGGTGYGNFTIGNTGLADLVYDIDLPLLHYWDLDETSGTTAYDSAGTLHGNVINAQIDQPGVKGRSYYFDGTDDYVEFDDDPSLNFNTGDDFSIYMWINTTANNVRFLSKRLVPGDARGYLMHIENNNFGIYLDFGSSGALVRGGPAINDGKWHQVGFCRSGSILEAFVDGVSIGTNIAAGGDLSNSNPLLLGAEQDGTLEFPGYIDDVKVFNQAVPPSGALNTLIDVGWLSVNPDSGIISPGGSTDHMVTVNTSGLSPGYYQASILIQCNDPGTDAFSIPVYLTVMDYKVLNIPLGEGWNLVSIPLIQDDTTLDQALASINGKWDIVQTYDPLYPGLWRSNCTFKPDQLNDLSSIDYTAGFWINITESNVTLSIEGFVPISTNIPLYAGWNLVGYPSLVNRTIANALTTTGYDQPVEGFSGASPYRTTPLPDTYLMTPGEAYWIHVPADTTWRVDW